VSGPHVTRGVPFSGAARLADDTRRRFLAAIVAAVPLERLVEVHLFAPIRQGGVETGVAVIAARPLEPALAEPAVAEAAPDASTDAPPVPPPAAGHAPAGDFTEDAAGPPPDVELPDVEVPDVEPPAEPRRLTVFTARYRLTLKGPDRGKWDADVVEEALAPLVTVEAVVRGVQRRAGDTAEPDRLAADLVARELGLAPPSA
jgi:hypothetical protein